MHVGVHTVMRLPSINELVIIIAYYPHITIIVIACYNYYILLLLLSLHISHSSLSFCMYLILLLSTHTLNSYLAISS